MPTEMHEQIRQLTAAFDAFVDDVTVDEVIGRAESRTAIDGLAVRRSASSGRTSQMGPPNSNAASWMRFTRTHNRARLVHPDASSELHEDRSQLQLDAARLEPDAPLVPVKEIVVSLDSPTSETLKRRILAMAAAAIVAVVGVAAIAVNTMKSDDDVEPAAVAPTAAPRRETGTSSRGTRVTYTVLDGWENTGYGVIKGDPAIGMAIDVAGNVHTSYCVTPGGNTPNAGNRPPAERESVSPPVGPTIDDLASAWANLPGVDAAAATDVAIDGFDAKQIELTVPDYAAGDCNGMFGFCAYGEQIWCESVLRDKDFPSDDASYQPFPHQHLKVWIVDVDGVRHMILAGFSPDTSPQDRAALDEIVASVQFG